MTFGGQEKKNEFSFSGSFPPRPSSSSSSSGRPPAAAAGSENEGGGVCGGTLLLLWCGGDPSCSRQGTLRPGLALGPVLSRQGPDGDRVPLHRKDHLHSTSNSHPCDSVLPCNFNARNFAFGASRSALGLSSFSSRSHFYASSSDPCEPFLPPFFRPRSWWIDSFLPSPHTSDPFGFYPSSNCGGACSVGYCSSNAVFRARDSNSNNRSAWGSTLESSSSKWGPGRWSGQRRAGEGVRRATLQSLLWRQDGGRNPRVPYPVAA